jgi:glycosyltransferase involved in cell wall biosynthesis
VNCLVGHLVDRCGSLRPHRSLGTLQRFRHEIRMSRKVLTLPVSHFLRARMVEAGCPEEQLRVIPSPAPRVDGPFQPVPTSVRPRFLFLGRLAPQKGISWLLRAFEGVSQNAELDIAGTGDLEDQARRFVERRGLSDRVTFHGWLEPTDLPPLFRGCRAVVFPSVWHEPAGLVALEAAAHGRALIASRVGGIPEYTCPDHAAFVPANDVSALTNAMSDLAGCAQRADRMGRSGWEAAQNRFSVDRFLQRMDSVYETVLAETMQTT